MKGTAMTKKKVFLYTYAGICFLLAGCAPVTQTSTEPSTASSGNITQETFTLPPEVETNPIFIHSDAKTEQTKKETEADIQAADGINLNTPVTVTENQKRSVTYTVEQVEIAKIPGSHPAMDIKPPNDAADGIASADDTHSYVWVTLKVHNNDPGKFVEFIPANRQIRFNRASDGTQPLRSIESRILPEKGYYPIQAGEDHTFILGYVVPDSLLSQMYLETGGRYGYTESCDMRFDFSEVFYLKLFK